MIFRSKGSTEVDMNQLEMQLRAAKKEVLSLWFGLLHGVPQKMTFYI